MALSGDGNTAIVGGPNDGGLAVPGAVWVYTRAGGVWSQQGAKLVGAGAVGFHGFQGQGVALSADGNTAIWSADDGETGSAWVFTRSSGVWTQQGPKLALGASSGSPFSGLSTSAALSADGNTAIVGSSGRYDGGALVFTRSGGIWSQQGSLLLGTGAVGTGYQGRAVALSADGNTAIMGGFGDNGMYGATWVFARSDGVWTQQGPKLVGTGAVPTQGSSGSSASWVGQGWSVALSGDGNTAIVGGWYDNNYLGAAWVFTRANGVWSQQGPKLVGAGAAFGVASYVQQGSSVALSADGNTALVGGFRDNGAVGATWVFKRANGVWSQEGGKLVGTGYVGSSLQGSLTNGATQGLAVALSADASTAIVGGPYDNNQTGATWVFAQVTLPTIAPGGVVNAASWQPGISPGTWITIMGANLSLTTRSWTSADFSGNNLPTQLGGVSVTVNGKPAYVAYVSPTQLNVLTPDDSTQGLVAIQVTTPQGQSNVAMTTEAAFAPALFALDQAGGQHVAAVRADGAYIGPPNLIPGLTTIPAGNGDAIMLFGTGFGPTTPANTIGMLVNPAPLANPVTVLLDGTPVRTQFAGMVGPGLYQFNLVVPPMMGSNALVTVEIGDEASQAPMYMAIQGSP
ncbi:MAG TPA: IPT/TIG domain-containing protein [Bryobacteraceae bacterium]|nr:IPT/TIG domain-containing protein [Bryobacteraceae bacterium]